MTSTLIIDDSSAMRKILTKIVSSIGFDTIEASNGKEGLEKLEEFQDDIDLILVDWNMPVMNGYEFVTAVRKREEFADRKLVMVTTETEPKQMVKALMAGVDEFVMKPFTSAILIEKLRLIGVDIPFPTSA